MPPDLYRILSDARDDQDAGRYEEALAKHLWFHEHALEHGSDYHGVRLSFALSWWSELGQEYPPALVRLRETRDRTREKILGTEERGDLVDAFADLAAINRWLQEDSHTRQTFEILDFRDSVAARRVYRAAQPALVRSKAYQLCGRYLDSKKAFEELKELFVNDLQMANDPRLGDDDLSFAYQRFTYEITTLAALLVVNDRIEEARDVASAARHLWDGPAMAEQLNEALKGTVPTPWP